MKNNRYSSHPPPRRSLTENSYFINPSPIPSGRVIAKGGEPLVCLIGIASSEGFIAKWEPWSFAFSPTTRKWLLKAFCREDNEGGRLHAQQSMSPLKGGGESGHAPRSVWFAAAAIPRKLSWRVVTFWSHRNGGSRPEPASIPRDARRELVTFWSQRRLTIDLMLKR